MSFSMRPPMGAKAKSTTVIAILALGFAVGCSVSLNDKKDGESGVLKYAFKDNDPLTGKTCWTDPHTYPSSDKEQFCKDLKDETTNNKCAIKQRRDRYLRECGIDFPPVEPVQVPSTPVPPPPPPPTPTVPSTSDRPAVALRLIAAGIEVRTPDIGGAPSTGEASFRTRLSRFWPVVEAKEQEILSRKGLISVLSVTDRASYNSTDKLLELAVNFTDENLSRYLKLISRRAALESNAGVSFSFGIDIDRNTAPDFSRVDAKTSFFEGQAPAIKSLSGLMKTVSLEGTTARLYLEEGQLVLPPTSYESDFKSASARLAPLASFARWAADQHLKLETVKTAGSNAHIELLSDDIGHLASAFTALDREHAALEDLIGRGVVSRLVLSPVDNFDLDAGVFTISMTDDGLSQLSAAVKAASTFESVAATFSNVTVERKQAHLDASFVECVKRMENYKDLIRTKLSKITKISLTTQASGFAGGVLTIGSDGRAADLETVIKNIKN